MKKYILLASMLFLLGGIFYLSYEVKYSKSPNSETKKFLVAKGDNAWEIAKNLKKEGIIENPIYFFVSSYRLGKAHSFRAGEFNIGPNLYPGDIVTLLTINPQEAQIKLTFPEGWTAKEMAKRLSANGLDGEGFLKIVQNPTDNILATYPFLTKGSTLEGYLFPDTYYFKKDASAELITGKMLSIFDTKVPVELRNEAKKQNKTLNEIITMASIIEGEVPTDADRKVVSGIFWNRIKNGQRLESCATLAYILGVNKKQYTLEDTKVKSPYNTYQNKGLPPGPIGNPGLSAIMAAVNPAKTDYVYFLSDPQTGKTVFSVTFEEHVANKDKYGL